MQRQQALHRSTQHQTVKFGQRQQQNVKLLAYPRLALVEHLNAAVLENPFLEEVEPDDDEEGSAPDAAVEMRRDVDNDALEDSVLAALSGDEPLPSRRQKADDLSEVSLENRLSDRRSLFDHLESQLELSVADPLLRRVGRAIIGNLDRRGFLDASIEELATLCECRCEDVERALAVCQTLDPAGIGARNLRDCLLIQLRRLDFAGSLVYRLVDDHFAMLESRRLTDVASALGVPVSEVVQCLERIRRLDRSPALTHSSATAGYIVPDVVVVKTTTGYDVEAQDDGLPWLRVRPSYRRFLDHPDDEVRLYARERLRAAHDLLKAVAFREKAIVRAARSVVRFQHDFLDHGVGHLRPLVLKDVADDIGMHISSVQRLVQGKYIDTPRGVYELRFFFHSSVKGSNGQCVSSMAVRARVKTLVGTESAEHPLSDHDIAAVLRSEGVRVSRRVIQKYRVGLGIPSATERTVFRSARQ